MGSRVSGRRGVSVRHASMRMYRTNAVQTKRGERERAMCKFDSKLLGQLFSLTQWRRKSRKALEKNLAWG